MKFVRKGILGVVVAICVATSQGQTFTGIGVGPIPDSAMTGPQQPGLPLEVMFSVTGLTSHLTNVSVEFTATHSWMGDLAVVLTSPGGIDFTIFAYTGATNAGHFGDGSDLDGTYTFDDSAVANWWTTAASIGATVPMPSGIYRTSVSGGAGSTGAITSLNAVFAGLTPDQVNGTWYLRFTDGANSDIGSVTAASLTFTTVPEPAVTGALTTLALGSILFARARSRQKHV